MERCTLLCLEDFERYAAMCMNPRTWIFFSHGSERENTLKENVRAFQRFKFIPRMLCNVESRDLSVTVLGDRMSFPVGLAPTGFQKLAHPDGEIAAAKGAGQAGVVYTLSTVSTVSLEDVASATRNYSSPLWMQVYVLRKRDVTERMIRRAEHCGYKALVFTVDDPVPGLRLSLYKSGFSLPPHCSVPNIEDSEGNIENSEVNIPGVSKEVDVKDWIFLPTITWDDIKWIKSISKLPIVLKGILSAQDARIAVSYGVSAIWVSNHGGRQLDGTFATVDVVSEIAAAVEGKCEVYMDGGVRWGSDVLKALALGARAVFIGRPLLWGLAHSGEEGVKRILEILRSELDRAMSLSGCRGMSDIDESLVMRTSNM